MAPPAMIEPLMSPPPRPPPVAPPSTSEPMTGSEQQPSKVDKESTNNSSSDSSSDDSSESEEEEEEEEEKEEEKMVEKKPKEPEGRAGGVRGGGSGGAAATGSSSDEEGNSNESFSLKSIFKQYKVHSPGHKQLSPKVLKSFQISVSLLLPSEYISLTPTLVCFQKTPVSLHNNESSDDNPLPPSPSRLPDLDLLKPSFGTPDDDLDLIPEDDKAPTSKSILDVDKPLSPMMPSPPPAAASPRIPHSSGRDSSSSSSRKGSVRPQHRATPRRLSSRGQVGAIFQLSL